MADLENKNALTIPGAGETITYQVFDGERISLDFSPEDVNMDLAREGDSLHITFEDGGTIVLSQFFDFLESNEPPVLTVADAELSSLDFLNVFAPDLAPAAGEIPGSRQGEYQSDPGNLIGGVDTLGDQSSMRWVLSTGGADEEEGDDEVPGGSVDFGFVTIVPDSGEDGQLSGRFTNVLFEDNQPNQHLLGQAQPAVDDPFAGQTPAVLEYSVSTTGTSTLTSLTMSGFPQGATVFVGDTQYDIVSADQVITLSGLDLGLPVSLYLPADNSDADVSLNVSATFTTAGGRSTTVSEQFTLVVDAVADRPDAETGAMNSVLQDIVNDAFGEYTSETEEVSSVYLPVSAEFFDLDGSEAHYIRLTGLPEGWELDPASLPAGYEVVVDYPADWQQYDGAPGTVTDAEGTATLVIKVPADAGMVDVNLKFDTGDWTTSKLDGGAANEQGAANITVSAIAWEQNLSGEEATYLNNYSEVSGGEYVVDIVEDEPQIYDYTEKMILDESGPAGAVPADILALAGAAEALSHASQNVIYDLKSDGGPDAFIGFELAEQGQASGWYVTGGEGDAAQQIYLYEVDGNIYGRVGGETGAVAFLISVTGATAESGINQAAIGFTQFLSMHHPDITDANELLSSSLELSFVVVDSDGDRTGSLIEFDIHDDAPGEITVIGAVNIGESGLANGAVTDFVDFDQTFVFGADGPHATVPFEWSEPEAGVFKTAANETIEWVVSDDGLTLTGYVGTEDNVAVKFETKADLSGYDVTLYKPLYGEGNVEIPLEFVIRDGDGDTVGGNSTVNVIDSTPGDTKNVSISVSETDLPAGTDPLHIINNVWSNIHNEAIRIGSFDKFDFGQDGPNADKPFSWNVPTESYFTTDGTPIVWKVSADGLTMIGYADGGSPYHDAVIIFQAGHVTSALPVFNVVLLDSIQHGEQGRDWVGIEAGYSIYDVDGSEVSADFTVNVRDDSPVIAPWDTENAGWVSETDLSGGSDFAHLWPNIPGNIGDESVLHGHLGFVYGADGKAAEKPFSWDVSELEAGETIYTFDANGKPVPLQWDVSEDGLTMFAYVDDPSSPVITVTAVLDPAGATYVVNLHGPLAHGEPGSGIADKVLELPFSFTVTDGDGDTATGNVSIKVLDDVPFAGLVQVYDQVFEVGLRGDGSISSNGSLTANFGGDGAHATTPAFWDKDAIEAEAGYYKAMLTDADGQPVATELTVEFVGDPDYPTGFQYFANGELVLECTISFDRATGKVSYEYNQYKPLEHEQGLLNPSNYERKLDLKYGIMDGDGDTAYNELNVLVMDDIPLPSIDLINFLDESNYDKSTGHLTSTFVLDHLDYGTADGLADASWSHELIAPVIGLYKAVGADERLVISADSTDKVLYITAGDGGPLALTLTLEFVDGKWVVHYDQSMSLDHPIGSYGIISHNDLISLPLTIVTTDGDGDTALNNLTVNVLDDAPSIPFGSNFGAEALPNFIAKGGLEAISSLVSSLTLGSLDLIQAAKDFATLMELTGDSLAEIMTGVDLLLGTSFSSVDWDLLGTFNMLNSDWYAELGNLASAFVPDLSNNPFTESAGNEYGSQIVPDFGMDGAHPTEALMFTTHGIKLMLGLIGAHKSGVDGPLDINRDHSDRDSYAKSGETVMDVVKATASDGTLVLTFVTYYDADGNYGYRVIQDGPLAHNPTLLDAAIDWLSGGGIGSSIIEGLDAILGELLGLGFSASDLLSAFTSMNTLGGDSLLILPLPIVAQDGDGDKTIGLTLTAIRDAVPVGGNVSTSIHEDNLGQAMVLEGMFDYGFDGPKASNPVEWKNLDGQNLVDAGGATVYAYDADGNPVAVVLSVSGSHLVGTAGAGGEVVFEVTIGADGQPVVTVHQPLFHEGGAANDIINLDLACTIYDGDNDSANSSLKVTIEDSLPSATNDTGAVSYDNDAEAWLAEGNVLDNDDFGADLRAVEGGFKIEDEAVEIGDSTVIQGDFGYLTIDGEGNYSYKFDADVAAETLTNNPHLGMIEQDVTESWTPNLPLGGATPGDNPGDFVFSAAALGAADPAYTLLAGYSILGSAALQLLNLPSVDYSGAVSSNSSGLGVSGGDAGDLIGKREAMLIEFPGTATDFTLNFAELGTTRVGLSNLSEKIYVVVADANGKMLQVTVVEGNSSGNVTFNYQGSAAAQVMIVGQAQLIGPDASFLLSGITINEGSQTHTEWVADPNYNFQESFDYLITDRDGDTSDGQLVIDVDSGNMVGEPTGTAAEFNEAHLADIGSIGGGVTAQNASIPFVSFTDVQPGEITIGGEAAFTWDAGTQTWVAVDSIALGALLVTGIELVETGRGQYELKFTYTLDSAHRHADEQGPNVFETGFDVVVGGHTVAVNVDIIDDVPDSSLAFTDEYNDVSDNIVAAGSTSQGQFDLVKGADAVSGDSFSVNGVAITADATSVVIAGYGTLLVNLDGSFSFEALPNITTDAMAEVVFSYTDSDDDTTSKTLSLGVEKPALPADIVLASTVYEAGLMDGNNAEGAEFGAIDGLSALLAAGWSVVSAGAGNAQSTIVQHGVGDEWHVQLLAAVTHGEPGSPTDLSIEGLSHTIQLQDPDGNVYNVPVSVTIKDDVPTLGVVDNDTDVSGTDLAIVGTWAHSFGADGGEGSKLEISINDSQFASATADVSGNYTFVIGTDTVILYANGNIGFQTESEVERDIALGIKITDADGDSVLVEDGITFTVGSSELDLADVSATVYESGMDGVYTGSFQGTDSTANTEYSNSGWQPLFGAGITLDVAAMQSAYGDDCRVTADYVYITGSNGELAIRLSDMSYRYELRTPVLHDTDTPDAGAGVLAQGVEDFTVHGKEVDGDKAGSFSLGIDVQDDAPILDVLGTGEHALGSDANFVFASSGSIAFNFGADGPNDGSVLSLPVELDWGQADAPALVSVPRDGSSVSVSTDMGELTLTYNAAENKMLYSYLAQRGETGDIEEIKLTITDADNDVAYDSIKFTLEHDVPAGVAVLDEAGLSGGSHHAGHGESTMYFSLDEAQQHPSVESISWDTETLSSTLGADVNGDGVYETVTWTQVGNNLVGSAGGEVVVEIAPEFVGGFFTGSFNATLNHPLDHTGASVDEALGVLIGLTMNTSNDGGIDTAIGLTVRDDVPVAQHDSIVVAEAVDVASNVYLVLDNSGSMYYKFGSTSYGTPNYMEKALDALKALVEKYAEIDPDVRITLLEFSSSGYAGHLANVSGTPAEIIEYLDAHTTSITNTTGGTNYKSALEWVQGQIEADMLNPDYRHSEHKVYFMSDGKPDSGGGAPSGWQNFADSNDIDVIAVGIAADNAALTALGNVANSGETVINVPANAVEYDELTDVLLGTIPTRVSGSLFDNDALSADATEVVSVEYNGVTYEVDPISGLTQPITLVEGTTIQVKANGEFEVIAGKNINQDEHFELAYTVKDADGDTSSANIYLTLRDAEPVASDNVAFERTYTDIAVTTKYDFSGDNYEFVAGGKLTGGANNSTLTMEGGNSVAAHVDANEYPADLAFRGDGGAFGGSNTDWDYSGNGSVVILSDGFESDRSFSFKWALDNGKKGASYDRDAAFVAIYDKDGNHVESKLLHQFTSGSGSASGTFNYTLGDNGPYSIKLVVLDIDHNADRSAQLTVTNFQFTDSERVYDAMTGNVIDDSWMGAEDVMADRAKLQSFEYLGKVYAFAGEVTITTDDGMFSMSNIGEWTYNDQRASFDDVNITYTLADQDDDTDSAVLIIRSEDHVFEGSTDHSGLDNGNNVYYGTDANDIIHGGDGDNAIYGGAGDDAIYGGTGNDRIFGGDGNDVIYGGDGNDLIQGGAGNDILYGGAGNDTIYGGDGDDIIYGGIGNDVLYGGAGSDTFAWALGDLTDGASDTIMDFNLYEDSLLFEGFFGNEVTVPTMNNILEQIQEGNLNISADNPNSLLITAGSNSIEVHLDGSGLTQDQYTAVNDGTEADKAAMLLQMFSVTGG